MGQLMTDWRILVTGLFVGFCLGSLFGYSIGVYYMMHKLRKLMRRDG